MAGKSTIGHITCDNRLFLIAAYRSADVFSNSPTEEDSPDDPRSPEPAAKPSAGLDLWTLANQLSCGASSLPLSVRQHVFKGGTSQMNIFTCLLQNFFCRAKGANKKRARSLKSDHHRTLDNYLIAKCIYVFPTMVTLFLLCR